MEQTLPDLQTSSGQVMSYDEDLCAGENLSSVASQPGGLQGLPTVSPAEYVQTPLVCSNMITISLFNWFYTILISEAQGLYEVFSQLQSIYTKV
jgi:hypothetical protein